MSQTTAANMSDRHETPVATNEPPTMSQREASLRSWLAFPYYAYVGTRLRGSVLRLSPAQGPRSGTFGKGKPSIRILTLGDSSAAAVGVEHTSGALAVHLARKLHERDGDTVAWHISGHNSATSGQIRDIVVPNLNPADYTHIVLQIGMNDLKNWHSGRRFCKEFGGLLYAVRTKFPEAKLFWGQGVDMTRVPALPQKLAEIANLRRVIINERGTQLCVERGAVPVTPLSIITADRLLPRRVSRGVGRLRCLGGPPADALGLHAPHGTRRRALYLSRVDSIPATG